MFAFNLFKSKTFYGALLTGVGVALSGNFTKPAILQGVGIIVGATGLRDAIAGLTKKLGG